MWNFSTFYLLLSSLDNISSDILLTHSRYMKNSTRSSGARYIKEETLCKGWNQSYEDCWLGLFQALKVLSDTLTPWYSQPSLLHQLYQIIIMYKLGSNAHVVIAFVSCIKLLLLGVWSVPCSSILDTILKNICLYVMQLVHWAGYYDAMS